MILKIFKATRPLNLSIILIAQILTSYFLGFGNSIHDVFDKVHLAVYSATLLCAMFGYLFNDVMDIKVDAINKPLFNFLSDQKIKNAALLLCFISVFLAIVIGFSNSYKLGTLITLVVLLLFFYNILLKRLPLIGNLLIAGLSAFPIFILFFFDANLNKLLIIIFSANAFSIHFIREIIKDIEDMKGDAEAGYKTLPIVAGIKFTRLFLLIILFIYILFFTTCVRLMMSSYFSEPLTYLFLGYNIICIGFPLFHLLSKLQIATNKNDYTYMSKVALYIMVTGTLSVLFF